MNKKTITLIACVLFAVVLGIFFSFKENKDGVKRVGVLVPIEHRALTDMVDGLKEGLAKTGARITVQNALGDLSLQRAIMQQYLRENYDVIVTIGTESSLLAMKEIKEIPLVALDVSERLSDLQNNITGLLESEVDASYHFLEHMFPKMQRVTLVYSASHKVDEQRQKFEHLAKAHHVQVQSLMVQELRDLYSIKTHIDPQSDLIFILKDHLVASGITTLIQASEQLNIPLVTSDDGTVSCGASMAYGNSEKDIGIAGSFYVKKILEGASPKTLPMDYTPTFNVFVNSQTINKQDPNLQSRLEDFEIKKVYISKKEV